MDLPIPRPSKIVCVGRNYADHAREFGSDVPGTPLLFLKPPSSLIPAGEPIRVPSDVGRVDFEGEVGVLVGRRLRKADPGECVRGVAGVLPANDVTARSLQKSDAQWGRAKGFDTFCPVGTPVPVAGVDLDDLTIRTRLNGELRQEANTSAMVFPISEILSFISGIMTLEPGDLILTGTPAGVGALSPGDEVEVEILGFGAVRNPVVRD